MIEKRTYIHENNLSFYYIWLVLLIFLFIRVQYAHTFDQFHINNFSCSFARRTTIRSFRSGWPAVAKHARMQQVEFWSHCICNDGERAFCLLVIVINIATHFLHHWTNALYYACAHTNIHYNMFYAIGANPQAEQMKKKCPSGYLARLQLLHRIYCNAIILNENSTFETHTKRNTILPSDCDCVCK